MMWPSQNFLQYNGTVIKIKVNEWINNKKNMSRQSQLHPYKLKQFNFKKEQTILIPVKYNHTCMQEINLMPSKRFSNFKIFLLKMKKIDNYDLNYHRYMVQPLVLRILRRSF